MAVKRRRGGTLDHYSDPGMSDEQVKQANIKLFRYIVHSNSPFNAVHSPYLQEFVDVLRPSYTVPTRYVLSHTLLDTEAARVQIEEISFLKSSNLLTFLTDGWEDMLRRALYGSLAAKVGQRPIILNLRDLTGHRGSAAKIVETADLAMANMELSPRNVIAATTDNPMTMQAFRRKFEEKYPWVITLYCFLHKLNTIVGKICAYPDMKKTVSRNARIVGYFNGSHYWGGQLQSIAAGLGVKRKLQTHSDTRWYTLVLQALSIQDYRQALVQLCHRPDAQKTTNGYSPIANDVIKIVSDLDHWCRVDQLVKTVKPLVDAIGNLESRDVTLADCMLELIRCARQMVRITLDDEDDREFWLHAKAVFNREFHTMNTNVHALALFLHPLCRKLAVNQAAKARSFEQMCTAALDIAQKWKWSRATALQLVENMQEYSQCRGPFAGGKADGKAWWESLDLNEKKYPIRTLALTLFSIVPHAADVERLFSDLGGIQGVKRCRLGVQTFETLGKLRSNYAYHAQQRALLLGKPVRRRHAHMHTRESPGINTDLAEDLDTTFSFESPLALNEEDYRLTGPEDISLAEIDKAFDELDKISAAELADPSVVENIAVGAITDVEVGLVYQFDELDRVDKGLVPVAPNMEINVHGADDGDDWDMNSVLLAKGVSNA